MDKTYEERLIAQLDAHWCEEGGFLFDYKAGKFNEDAYESLNRTIVAINPSGEELISRRLVARIYNIPFFLQRHKKNVLRAGGSKMLCNYAINVFNNLLDRIFSYNSIMDWFEEKSSAPVDNYMFDFDD